MCGRYTIRRLDTVIRLRGVEPAPFEEISDLKINLFADWRPRYNAAPSQLLPIVRLNAAGERAVGYVKWGLIPSWTKGKPKLQPINARDDTVATSGMFKQALARRRCLIPADGFYEPKGPAPKRVGPKREQYFICRRDDAPFTFAGIWERWKPDEQAEPIDTFALITTSPNADVGAIHDRMPVILHDQDHERWLDRNVDGEGVMDLLCPYEDSALACRQVSLRINDPSADDPSMIDPI